MKRRILLPVVAILIVFASLLSLPGCEKHYTVSNFTVYTRTVEPVELEEFIGKPIVVNFWATWCGYCIMEMPAFNEAYHANPDVQFMMVNYTQGDETIAVASSFVLEKGYDFPVYYDAMGDASLTYEVESFPTTLFIDRDGNLVKRVSGAMSKEELDGYLALIK